MSTALITGASAGIGFHLANLFARDGHAVILVARRKDLLQKISADFKKQYPQTRVTVIDMDLSANGAGHTLKQKINELGLQVDFLVNNAGFGSNGAFQDLPLDKELQMIDLNVRTLTELTGYFLPGMLQRKFGRILNIGSTGGLQPGPFIATYFATKAFVNSFSQALAEELRGTGVTCTVLLPGATATEFAKVANLEKSKLFTMNKPASAEVVALCGYKAMMRGRAFIVQGFTNNLLMQMLRLAPRFLPLKITRYLTGR